MRRSVYSIVFVVSIFALQACSSSSLDKMISFIDVGGSLAVTEKGLPANLIEIKKIVNIPLTDSTLLKYSVLDELNRDDAIISSDTRVLLIDMEKSEVLLSLSRQGNGPQEYLEVGHVSANWEKQELYVFDIQKRHANVYSFKGDFLRAIRPPGDPCGEVTSFGDVLVWGMMSHGESIPWLYITDEEGHRVDSSKSMAPVTKSFMSFSPSLVKNGLDLLFQTFNSDTLFKISEEKITPVIILSRGKKKMPLEYYSSYDLYYRYGDEYIVFGPCVVSEDLLFLEYDYHKTHYLDIWSMVSGQLVARRTLQRPGDLKGFPIVFEGETRYFWPNLTNGNYLVGLDSTKEDSIELIVAEKTHLKGINENE